MIAGDLSIAVVTSHARDVAAPERERLAMDLRTGLAGRGLVLETCHRVEAYAAGPDETALLASVPVPVGARSLLGEDAVRHAVRVAVGRDSVVVGEDQILHQLRVAVDHARAGGGLDPALERLFSAALRAGRLARSWRTGPSRSLAAVAVAEIAARTGSLRERPLLVVGAGQVGRSAARAAVQMGARVSVTSRTTSTAVELARHVGGRSLPFDPGHAVREFVGIVIGLSGAWTIAPTTVEELALRRRPVVDLSVPSALAADVRDRLGLNLISADDLARTDVGTENPDERTRRRGDRLIDRTSTEFVGWLEARDRRDVAAALADRAAAAREAELAELWRRLPALDPDARRAIDAMTRHLADRLLREPLDQLGRDVDGGVERAIRAAFAL